jgi:short-subunit dehydrogenase
LPTENGAAELDGVFMLEGDVTVPQFRHRFVKRATEDHGRIDVLINSAGVGLYAPASGTSVALARRLFDINFFAALEMVHLVLPFLEQQGGGAIVNMGSIGGRVSLPWSPIYCASKHALHALSDGLHRELRHQNIHVMTVIAGIVRTNFRSNVLAGKAPPAVERMPMMPPERLAQALIRGLQRRQRFVVRPWAAHGFEFLNRWFPSLIDAYCERKYAEPPRARHAIRA